MPSESEQTSCNPYETRLEHGAMTPTDTDDPLMRPADAARLLGVNRQTLARWAREGTLPCIVTEGGHRRYRTSEVRRRLDVGETVAS